MAILVEVHNKEYITKVYEPVHKCMIHIQLAQCTIMDYLKLGNINFGTCTGLNLYILCLFDVFDQNVWDL